MKPTDPSTCRPGCPDLETVRWALEGLTPRPIGRYRYYSVLIPLIEKEDGLHVLFQVRADGLRHQPGEIGLPGGKVEPGESPQDCAVRETGEELGMAETDVAVLGEVNYLITYSNFTMYAFAGTLNAEALAAATPNPEEVKELFLVPLTFFLQTKPESWVNQIAPGVAADFPLEKIRFKEGYGWRTGDSTVPIYSYYDGEAGTERVIWGLTARLMEDFSRILQRSMDGSGAPGQGAGRASPSEA